MPTCDECSAGAYVVVTKGALELAFCAHHYGKRHVGLREQGFGVLVDRRDELLVKP